MWLSLPDLRIRRWHAGTWIDEASGGPRTADAYCEDASGRIWIADVDRCLWCREAGVWKSWRIPQTMESRVNSISAGPDGTLWLASYRAGVCGFRDGGFFEPRTGSEVLHDLTENVLADRDGGLWLGSSTNGLYSLTPQHVSLATLEGPDAHSAANFIGSLVETSPGAFMIGSQGRGLFRWEAGRSEPVSELGGLNRGLFGNSMARTLDGVIWAGTGRGLFAFGPDGRLIQRSRETSALPDVWEVCSDANGGLWVGRGNGELQHLTDKPSKVDYGGKSANPVKGLAVAPDGALWIGTRGNGLFRMKDGKSRRFGVNDGLLSEVIRALYFSADGILWVGTAGGGLAVLQDDHFCSFTTDDGLPDDIISQMTEDAAGRLWLGTNRGLAVLEKPELDNVRRGIRLPLHPTLINRADGLVSEECTIVPPVHMHDGRMAFATTHGFALLQPGEFHAETRTPPVFIERVIANGSDTPPTNGFLPLPPGLERLEIEFTGLHFAAAGRLRFRSRLIGVDRQWSAASPMRRVEYRHLAPGTYRFEVSSAIGNGPWAPVPTRLEIVLAPHFWQTLWFQGTAVLAALGLAAAFTRWLERTRARRKIVALRREHAIQDERARIARDLHDDVGSSLTQVALLSELAATDLTERPEQARDHINEIFTTAKDLTRSLDEIVWAVNPAQDTLERFAAFLGTYVQGYARSAGLTARIEMPGVIPAMAVSSPLRHHLYLATKEALHNVVKHSGAAEIRFRLIPEPAAIRLVIEDNGHGFGGNSHGAGDGLHNLTKRLAQIGGSCSHHSAPGRGTIVEFFAPLSSE